ncbi:MAG TPA: L,D-transpeptidase [Vicinamibacterales bacterium]|nr:L,D-transpeptidase [Vicinamibacterales bacterium]
MGANRAMWTAAMVVTGVLAGTRAQAADTVPPEAVVRRVVVSIPDRKLAVVENDEIVQVFDVAVGAPASPSPTGTFTIVNRVANPTYYHPGTVIAPGPRNPIGTRWIGLSQKGYGIHGTDQPSSIGYAQSHGCIRLRNADVEQLFERVRPGDVVELHAERTTETDLLFAPVD